MTDEKILCPLKHLNNVFGGKWKLPIICILSADESPKRYSVIKRRLGTITNLMLSQSLRELEESGLVHREQFNEVPPHVEYSLTEEGRGALPFLSSAAQWALDDMKRKSIRAFCADCMDIN